MLNHMNTHTRQRASEKKTKVSTESEIGTFCPSKMRLLLQYILRTSILFQTLDQILRIQNIILY